MPYLTLLSKSILIIGPAVEGTGWVMAQLQGGEHKMSPLTFLFLVYDRRFQPSPQESELPPPTCGSIFIQSYEANKSTLSSSISLSAVILLRSCKFKSLFFFFSALTLDAAKTKRTNFPLQRSSSLPPPSRFYVIALIVGCHEGRATGILEVVCPPLRWRASKANLGDAHCRPVSSFITGLWPLWTKVIVHIPSFCQVIFKESRQSKLNTKNLQACRPKKALPHGSSKALHSYLNLQATCVFKIWAVACPFLFIYFFWVASKNVYCQIKHEKLHAVYLSQYRIIFVSDKCPLDIC